MVNEDMLVLRRLHVHTHCPVLNLVASALHRKKVSPGKQLRSGGTTSVQLTTLKLGLARQKSVRSWHHLNAANDARAQPGKGLIRQQQALRLRRLTRLGHPVLLLHLSDNSASGIARGGLPASGASYR